jgi:hypothetical protein
MRSVTEELEDWKHLNFAATGQEGEKDTEPIENDEKD